MLLLLENGQLSLLKTGQPSSVGLAHSVASLAGRRSSWLPLSQGLDGHCVELLELPSEGLCVCVFCEGSCPYFVNLRSDQESEGQLVMPEEAHRYIFEQQSRKALLELTTSHSGISLASLVFPEHKTLSEQVSEPTHRELVHDVECRKTLNREEQASTMHGHWPEGFAGGLNPSG